MGLTLRVDSAAWQQMVNKALSDFPEVIPVVKGNGYGFGRPWLLRKAQELGATEVAVGSIFEVADAAEVGLTPIVLTPSLDLGQFLPHPSAVLTVGSDEQLGHLLRFRPAGSAVVKVLTSMRRHGFGVADATDAAGRLAAHGVSVHSYAVHPGLNLDAAARYDEVATIVAALPSGSRVTLSHVDVDSFVRLGARFPNHRFSMRLGSMLWHGDKEAFSLTAVAIDVRPVRAGDAVGYRGVAVPGDGTLVVVDAGASHGVQPFADGSSPFHFARRRLALLEPPHLHVSMVFVPTGDPTPSVGDRVDVQRPLITTQVDQVVWA